MTMSVYPQYTTTSTSTPSLHQHEWDINDPDIPAKVHVYVSILYFFYNLSQSMYSL